MYNALKSVNTQNMVNEKYEKLTLFGAPHDIKLMNFTLQTTIT